MVVNYALVSNQSEVVSSRSYSRREFKAFRKVMRDRLFQDLKTGGYIIRPLEIEFGKEEQIDCMM
jgi:pyridoxine/pyridoxamine 5'-phosphate oxidase